MDNIERRPILVTLSARPNPMRAAIQNGDKDLALQMIEEGLDPFQGPHENVGGNQIGARFFTALRRLGFPMQLYWRSPFHDASSRRDDINLLLAMAAEPGSPWTQKFLMSQGKVVSVPERGRPSIAAAEVFFLEADTASMESLELMVMYGYKLKPKDFKSSLVPLAICDPNKTNLLEFILASQSSVTSGALDLCLAIQIGISRGSVVWVLEVLTVKLVPNLHIIH